MLPYTELKLDKIEVSTKRTKEVYNRHLELVQRDQSIANGYGVKRNSEFNKLEFLHITRGLPPDRMHDLLEGVIPKFGVKY